MCGSERGNRRYVRCWITAVIVLNSRKKRRKPKRNSMLQKSSRFVCPPVIDKHDFDTKMRHARKWIEDGMKVKVDMRFRGRLITRLEVGKKIMNSFTEEISDIAIIEKRPILEGNTMSCVLAPKKNRYKL